MISRDAKLALIALVTYLLLSGRADPLARSLKLSRQQLLLIAAAGAASWLWKSGDLKLAGGFAGCHVDDDSEALAACICHHLDTEDPCSQFEDFPNKHEACLDGAAIADFYAQHGAAIQFGPDDAECQKVVRSRLKRAGW